MMFKKFIVLTSIVLLLGSVSIAEDIKWTGLGADNLWSTPENWDLGRVPTLDDEVRIDVPEAADPNGPVIQEGIDAQAKGVFTEAAGESMLTITGGTLEVAEWIWWGDDMDSFPVMNMSGGTVSVTNEFELGWGGGGGTLTITGGTIKAGEAVIPTSSGALGQLNLIGGTYNVTKPGGLEVNATGQIDIVGGTLVVEGDETAIINELIAAGQITAYGGAGQLVMDFDVTNPGKTTLAAISKAKDPVPADGASVISPKRPLSTYISSDVPKNIPGPSLKTKGETSSSLTVSDSLVITDLNVELDISHPQDSDLDVYLIGPDGTQVELFTDDGFLSKNFTNTILDDEAGTSITSGSGPFIGMFKPEGKLSAFDGKNAQGTWKLKVQDDWYPDYGILNSWRLVIESPNMLSWTPAEGVATQELYVSDNFDDVNDSNDTAYQGTLSGDTSGIEIDLDLGQTFYWRIDSLNADDMLIGTGDIWSFSTMDVNDTNDAATNPVPADGAIEVVQDTILEWSHGFNAVSSDVYFGTENPPAFVETTSGDSFDVGKLATSTTYYWQIDETDADGTLHAGSVWSFTTVLGEATEPDPADLAADVPVDAVLSWRASATAASYDVYFGTTDSPEFMGNQEEASFDPNGLAYATMYYWKVDAIDVDGSTHPGALWTFMTPSGEAADPDPADGATINVTSAVLNWTAGDGAAMNDVYFGADPNELEYQGSQAETDFAVDGLSVDTTYYWQIIEVEDDGITIHASPVWSFTVPPLAAYDPSPSDGEVLASDATVTLSWKAGLGVEVHMIYFGEDPNSLAEAGATEEPNSPIDPNVLEPGKTYYWRIDEFSTPDTVTGAVWSFSLAEPAPEPEPNEPNEPVPVPEPNLLDLVQQINAEGDLAGTLDTFIAAVEAADLTEDLATEEDITVFVPTDDAFAALALELTPDNIGQLNLEYLYDMLLYHATGGHLLLADVLAVDHFEMLDGGNVNQFAGVLTDHLGRKSQIIVTDMEASNGVLHVINNVLLPGKLPAELEPIPEPEPEPAPEPEPEI